MHGLAEAGTAVAAAYSAMWDGGEEVHSSQL